MQNTNTSLLSVKNLSTHFTTDEGTVRAIEDVSFDIAPGQTIGVVGESGCGKSTIGRSILGILDRNGSIVNGQVNWMFGDDSDKEVDIAQLNQNGREMQQIRGGEIALVFQEPMSAFSPVHTLGNQMREMIQLHQKVGKKEATEMAIDLLRQVGVPRPEQRVEGYVWQLSGGLRQRAMIAMAISNRPKLLIADEPTTSLDVTTQAQILDLLRGLQEQYGMAIMLITHNLGVVAEMADEVVVLYLGRNVETGPVDDIFHQPKHPYTQALLKSIPSATGEAEGGRLPAIAGTIPHPFNRPPGCPFHNRCSEFMEGVCDTKLPEFLPIGDSQTVSCFLHHGGQE